MTDLLRGSPYVWAMRMSALLLGVCLASAPLAGCAGVNPDRSAGNLGTNVCITNATSTSVTVAFVTADSSRGAGTLAPGAIACGEGTRFIGKDVTGYINQGTAGQLTFDASNPWIGAPYVEVAMTNNIGMCTGSGWDVGESHTMSSPRIAVAAVRERDDAWKEFAITLTDGDGSERGSTCQIDPI